MVTVRDSLRVKPNSRDALDTGGFLARQIGIEQDLRRFDTSFVETMSTIG